MVLMLLMGCVSTSSKMKYHRETQIILNTVRECDSNSEKNHSTGYANKPEGFSLFLRF